MEKFQRYISRTDVEFCIANPLRPVLDYMMENTAEIYKITCSPSRDSRSTQQNRYYWAIVHIITEWENKYFDRGWSEDDTHRYLKSEYFVDPGSLEEAVRELNSGALTTREFLASIMKTMDETTTTDKDTKEFAQIIDKIRADYEAKGLTIDPPNMPPLSAYNDF